MISAKFINRLIWIKYFPPIVLIGILVQCVNPQITSDGFVVWRDISSLDHRHQGRFQFGQDRLIALRIDTLLQPSESFTLSGRELEGSYWGSQNRGCLRVPSGVTVNLRYFNFVGKSPLDTLIIVDGGTLVLENCELSGPAASGIMVRNNGLLRIRTTELIKMNGPILINNSQLDLADCSIELSSGDAINIASEYSQKISHLTISEIDGNGIISTGTGELFLSNIAITRTMHSGINLIACERITLDSTTIHHAGGNGLIVSNCANLKMNYADISGCQHAGIMITDTPVLSFTNLSVESNQDNGIEIVQFDSLSVEQTSARKNGKTGIFVSTGSYFNLNEVQCAENGESGFVSHNTIYGSINSTQIKLNDSQNQNAGMDLSIMDSVSIQSSDFGFNLNSGLRLTDIPYVKMSGNQFLKNGQSGADLQNIHKVRLLQNGFLENDIGVVASAVDSLIHIQNRYENNGIGFSAVVSKINSRFNDYSYQQNAGIHLTGSAITIWSDKFTNNQTGLVSTKSEISISESSFEENDLGCSLDASNLNLQGVQFSFGKQALSINDSPQVLIQNCEFRMQESRAANISKSHSLTFSNNNILDMPIGFDINATDNVVFTHNNLERISDKALILKSAKSSSIQYNLFIENMSSIYLLDNKVLPGIENNTFVRNTVCFDGGLLEGLPVSYNIFQGNESLGRDLNGAGKSDWTHWTYNCFWKNGVVPEKLLNETSGNFIADPVFHDSHFLKAGSPCLAVGPGKRMVGARGLSPALKPNSN